MYQRINEIITVRVLICSLIIPSNIIKFCMSPHFKDFGNEVLPMLRKDLLYKLCMSSKIFCVKSINKYLRIPFSLFLLANRNNLISGTLFSYHAHSWKSKDPIIYQLFNGKSQIFLFHLADTLMELFLKKVQSNLNITNYSVRPFLFTISNYSLYEM